MSNANQSINKQILAQGNTNEDFPYAPEEWAVAQAKEIARTENIKLTDDHWNVIRALQEYFAKHEDKIKIRDLHDALDERFHHQGGFRYLYTLFPDGPVAHGCKLAGLEVPTGVVDESFGSVI